MLGKGNKQEGKRQKGYGLTAASYKTVLKLRWGPRIGRIV